MPYYPKSYEEPSNANKLAFTLGARKWHHSQYSYDLFRNQAFLPCEASQYRSKPFFMLACHVSLSTLCPFLSHSHFLGILKIATSPLKMKFQSDEILFDRTYHWVTENILLWYLCKISQLLIGLSYIKLWLLGVP